MADISQISTLTKDENLFLAVYKHNLLSCKTLLMKGANPATVFECGLSSVTLALQFGQKCLASLLYSYIPSATEPLSLSVKMRQQYDTKRSGMCFCYQHNIGKNVHEQPPAGRKRHVKFISCGNCLENACITDSPLDLIAQENSLYHGILMRAGWYSQYPLMDLLLRAGDDPHATDNNGMGLVHVASCKKNSQLLKTLLNGGWDPNQKDLQGATALHIAASNGFIAGARVLLEFRAKINVTNRKDETPLYCALEFEEMQMAKFLISNKAKGYIKTITGIDCMNFACTRKYFDIMELLAQNQCNVCYSSVDLVDAVSTGRLQIVEAFMKFGNNSRERIEVALKAAISQSKSSITRFLLQSGDTVDFSVSEVLLSPQFNEESYDDFVEIFQMLIHKCKITSTQSFKHSSLVDFALTKKHYSAARFLLGYGYPMSFDWTAVLYGIPLPLMVLCRKVIIQSFGNELPPLCIHKLPVSSLIKEYLLYSDLDTPSMHYS